LRGKGGGKEAGMKGLEIKDVDTKNMDDLIGF